MDIPAYLNDVPTFINHLAIARWEFGDEPYTLNITVGSDEYEVKNLSDFWREALADLFNIDWESHVEEDDGLLDREREDLANGVRLDYWRVMRAAIENRLEELEDEEDDEDEDEDEEDALLD